MAHVELPDALADLDRYNLYTVLEHIMIKHTVQIEGLGDSCARSHHMKLKAGETVSDPEMEFEAELLAALEKETATASVD